jgi:hypothetical protein
METNGLINKRPNFPDQWHPEVWGNLISGYRGIIWCLWIISTWKWFNIGISLGGTTLGSITSCPFEWQVQKTMNFPRWCKKWLMFNHLLVFFLIYSYFMVYKIFLLILFFQGWTLFHKMFVKCHNPSFNGWA